jgi:adenylylsulfate kinase-like enzyme
LKNQLRITGQKIGNNNQISQKATQNKSCSTVPGVRQPYEAPLNPDVVVKNFTLTPEEAAKQIFEAINAKK